MDILLKIILIVSPWLCETRVIYAPRQARHSIAEPYSYYITNINGVPGTYSFGYDTYDPATGSQFRREERYPNGTVVGNYGYIDARGIPQSYRYIADEKGYRVMNGPIYTPAKVQAPEPPSQSIPTEPSVTWTRPKRPNKNKGGSYFTRMPIQKTRNYYMNQV